MQADLSAYKALLMFSDCASLRMLSPLKDGFGGNMQKLTDQISAAKLYIVAYKLVGLFLTL